MTLDSLKLAGNWFRRSYQNLVSIISASYCGCNDAFVKIGDNFYAYLALSPGSLYHARSISGNGPGDDIYRSSTCGPTQSMANRSTTQSSLDAHELFQSTHIVKCIESNLIHTFQLLLCWLQPLLCCPRPGRDCLLLPLLHSNRCPLVSWPIVWYTCVVVVVVDHACIVLLWWTCMLIIIM